MQRIKCGVNHRNTSARLQQEHGRSGTDCNAHRRALLSGAASSGASVLCLPETSASAAGGALSRGWQLVTGAQPDIFFPDTFRGIWRVQALAIDAEAQASSLSDAEKSDIDRVNARARGDSKPQPLEYRQRFIPAVDRQQMCIADRAFNLAELEAASEGGSRPSATIMQKVSWDPANPNVLQLEDGSCRVFIRVTRRRQDFPSNNQIDASELFETVISRPESTQPLIRRSRVSTKFKYREPSELPSVGSDRQPPAQIIASQVVGTYPSEPSASRLSADNSPLALFRYRLAFFRDESE